jgi:hypothetical protein
MKLMQMIGQRSSSHECWRQGWQTCTACNGRIHQAGCTSRPDKHKDCCEARHKMLHDQGHTHGLDDSSIVMYDPNNPGWDTSKSRMVWVDVNSSHSDAFLHRKDQQGHVEWSGRVPVRVYVRRSDVK